MSNWKIIIKIPHFLKDNVINYIGGLSPEALSWYEEENGEESSLIDDLGFPISYYFYVWANWAFKPDIEKIKKDLSILEAIYQQSSFSISLNPIEDCDWLSECYKGFPPQEVGRFYICGEQKLVEDKILLQINAATAFGSGEHQSTKGCLMAIDDLAKDLKCDFALDLGCGSGILAIAMAKIWKCKVMAVDCDQSAIDVTIHNAKINDCDNLIMPAQSMSFDQLNQSLKFQVITANILAKPLCQLAARVPHFLNGVIILSGLLENQESMVLNCYQKVGIILKKRYILDQWVTLVLGSSASAIAP